MSVCVRVCVCAFYVNANGDDKNAKNRKGKRVAVAMSFSQLLKRRQFISAFNYSFSTERNMRKYCC